MPSPRLPRPTRFLVRRTYATTAVHPPLSALSPTARAKAEELSARWTGTSATGGKTKNFINGEFIESEATEWIDVVDPVCLRPILPDYMGFGVAYIVDGVCRQHKHCSRVFRKRRLWNSSGLRLLRRRHIRPGVNPAYSLVSVSY